MLNFWSFYGVGTGKLLFGRGSHRVLGDELRSLGATRVLLIADQNLERVGIVERIAAVLRDGNIDFDTFLEGQAEPSIGVAQAACQQARECSPQAIIAVGGGSNIDVAKFVAAVVSHGGQPQDYFGIEKVPGAVCPLIAIPTTSGTGSEVSHAAVLTDTDNAIKISGLSQSLRPVLAIVDPQLTDSCPPQVTADSGIDALTHAIEAKTNTPFDRLEIPPGQVRSYQGSHPLGGLLADRAIELVGKFLPRAVADGSDQEARDQMALAATLAGMAFSNCGVALVHALEYPLGGKYHCSHGAGNGLLLPYVMKFNHNACPAKMAEIGKLLDPHAAKLTQAEAGVAAIEAVFQLRAQIGIPHRLREFGAQAEHLDALAEKSFAISRLMLYNARRPELSDLKQILHEAL